MRKWSSNYCCERRDVWVTCFDISCWPSNAIWRHIDLGSISSGNRLLPDGTKPLPEPMLTYHRKGLMAFTPGHFHGQYAKYQSLKWIWILLESTAVATNLPEANEMTFNRFGSMIFMIPHNRFNRPLGHAVYRIPVKFVSSITFVLPRQPIELYKDHFPMKGGFSFPLNSFPLGKKWLPFRRRCLPMHFREWNKMYLD